MLLVRWSWVRINKTARYRANSLPLENAMSSRAAYTRIRDAIVASSPPGVPGIEDGSEQRAGHNYVVYGHPTPGQPPVCRQHDVIAERHPANGEPAVDDDQERIDQIRARAVIGWRLPSRLLYRRRTIVLQCGDVQPPAAVMVAMGWVWAAALPLL
jgi:hypothetical protein